MSVSSAAALLCLVCLLQLYLALLRKLLNKETSELVTKQQLIELLCILLSQHYPGAETRDQQEISALATGSVSGT